MGYDKVGAIFICHHADLMVALEVWGQQWEAFIGHLISVLCLTLLQAMHGTRRFDCDFTRSGEIPSIIK